MSARRISLARWLGNDAPPLDPGAMRYRAQLATGKRGCTGCVFKGQHSKVCVAAGARARQAGQPDCEDQNEAGRTFVYVLAKIEIDPRQLSLIPELTGE